MTRFPLQVTDTIRRFALVSPGDRVLVALSGGADSTALLHVLHQVLPGLGATLAGVVHVHHGLRGQDADMDRDWCREVTERLGLLFRDVHVDVLAEAQGRRWSIERAAHHLRHAAFRRVADELGTERVALGHTRDDQAETVVLRFLRGAGTRGMGGMHPKRGRLIRPLLETSRTHVEQFLAERGLTCREDASNADLGIPRNRVRHEVLPMLVRVAGARFPARLARQAERWRAEEQWLQQSAEPWIARAVTAGASGRALELDVLEEAPEALRGRVLLALARQLVGDGATARTVGDLERSTSLRDGRCGRFGGWKVVRQGTRLVFEPDGPAGPAGKAGPSDAPGSVGAGPAPGTRAGLSDTVVPLPVPGTADWAAAGLIVRAELADRRTVRAEPDALGPFAAMLDAAAVGERLVIRSWQRGDAMRPIGLGGSQKLQDLFVNRKVPRTQRSRVPVVSTLDGHIVWVVGLAVDERAAVKSATTRVVILNATHPGGKA